MLKQNLRLQKELLNYKAIANEVLFPDVASSSYLLPDREKYSATNPTTLRPYQSTASVAIKMPQTKQALIVAAHERDQPCCSKDFFAEPTALIQHAGFQNPTSRLENWRKNDKNVPRQLKNSAKKRIQNTASEFRTGGSMLLKKYLEFTSVLNSRYSPVENEHVEISVPHSIPKTPKADGSNDFSTVLNECNFECNDAAIKSDFLDSRCRKMFQPCNLLGAGYLVKMSQRLMGYEQGQVDGTLHARYSTTLEMVVETPLEGSVAKELTI